MGKRKLKARGGVLRKVFRIILLTFWKKRNKTWTVCVFDSRLCVCASFGENIVNQRALFTSSMRHITISFLVQKPNSSCRSPSRRRLNDSRLCAIEAWSRSKSAIFLWSRGIHHNQSNAHDDGSEREKLYLISIEICSHKKAFTCHLFQFRFQSVSAETRN